MTDRDPILWVIKGLARGGAERLVTSMAPRFEPLGFDVDVAFVMSDANDFVPELRSRGIEVHDLGGQRNLETGWPRALRRLLRRPYRLVHTHSPLPAVVVRSFAPDRLPLVHTEHNMWGVYRQPTRALNAATLRRNAEVFAVSDGVRDSMSGSSRRTRSAPAIETVLHGVDLEQVMWGSAARSAARSILGLAADAKVVGNVANLSQKKDHRTLLSAFRHVLHDHPDAILLLVGMGPLKEELEDHARSLGLEDRVRFLGSRNDVPAILPAMDVFVLSSLFEGRPISLLEAMSAGIACVSTAVGGIPEVIRDGKNGRLVPTKAPGQLGVVLTALLDDPASREDLGKAARETVMDGFSIEGAVSRYATAYRTVLASTDPIP